MERPNSPEQVECAVCSGGYDDEHWNDPEAVRAWRTRVADFPNLLHMVESALDMGPNNTGLTTSDLTSDPRPLPTLFDCRPPGHAIHVGCFMNMWMAEEGSIIDRNPYPPPVVCPQCRASLSCPHLRPRVWRQRMAELANAQMSAELANAQARSTPDGDNDRNPFQSQIPGVIGTLQGSLSSPASWLLAASAGGNGPSARDASNPPTVNPPAGAGNDMDADYDTEPLNFSGSDTEPMPLSDDDGPPPLHSCPPSPVARPPPRHLNSERDGPCADGPPGDHATGPGTAPAGGDGPRRALDASTPRADIPPANHAPDFGSAPNQSSSAITLAPPSHPFPPPQASIRTYSWGFVPLIVAAAAEAAHSQPPYTLDMRADRRRL